MWTGLARPEIATPFLSPTDNFILGFKFRYSTLDPSLMFYDKGSYASLGNFPSVEWIYVNITITTNCTDNILWLVDSWYFMLSIDHHLWTVRPLVKDLSMSKSKCWWIFKLWHSYICHKTWKMLFTIYHKLNCYSSHNLHFINGAAEITF